MTFAQKPRELRGKQGLSDTNLAALPFGTVHDYGLGRRMPTFPFAIEHARPLGVSADAFADCSDVDGPPARPARKGKQ
jgi:hypothetical protein